VISHPAKSSRSATYVGSARKIYSIKRFPFWPTAVMSCVKSALKISARVISALNVMLKAKIL